jgi:hypothetical protein
MWLPSEYIIDRQRAKKLKAEIMDLIYNAYGLLRNARHELKDTFGQLHELVRQAEILNKHTYAPICMRHIRNGVAALEEITIRTSPHYNKVALSDKAGY